MRTQLKKTWLAAAAGCAALAMLGACGGSNTAELAAERAGTADLQGRLAQAPTGGGGGGASSEELETARAERETARRSLAATERMLADRTGERDAARAARDRANMDLTDAMGRLSTVTGDLTRTQGSLSLRLAELEAANMPNFWTLPFGAAARVRSIVS